MEKRYRIEERKYQLVSLPIMSADTINASEKIDMVLNYLIGGNEIDNNNKEDNIFNDNEIEINYKNINTVNGRRKNVSNILGQIQFHQRHQIIEGILRQRN